MIKLKMAVAAVVMLALGACQNSNMGENQQLGAVLGGIAGAVAGAQFGKGDGRVAAAAAGTLLGAWAGSEIGRRMDANDRRMMGQTTQRALEAAPSNQPVAWRNPDSGVYGDVTPLPARQLPSGEYCREFTQTVVIGGQKQQAVGTACRNPDGSWRIVS